MTAQSSFVLAGRFLLVLCVAILLSTACSRGTKKDGAQPIGINVDPSTEFKATPNPIILTDGSTAGVTTLTWKTGKTKYAEIHIGSPNGKLFCGLHDTGSCQTGKWVSDGMTFYLQDTSAAHPTDPSSSLASVTVRVRSE